MSPSKGWRIPGAALFLFCFLLGLGVVSAPARASEPESQTENDRLPRLQNTGVLIPWSDFKKILDEIRAAHPQPTPAPPPVDFALTACQASVVVGGDETRAQVRLEFGVQVLNRDAWVEVPVLGEGVALSRFDLDGRPASAYSEDGEQKVALRGEGRHTLVLEYLTQTADNRGSRSLSLRFPQAPVVALDLVIPRPGMEVELPGAVVRAIERSGGQTRVRGAYQRAGDASVTWSKQVELGEKETKVTGETRTLLSIGEGMMRGTAIAAYTIHGRGVDAFRVALPAGITVLDVTAQGMKDWSVVEEKAGRVLLVRLNYVAQGSYELQATFEQEIKDADAKGTTGTAGADGVSEVRAPDLALLDVLRDKGFIAVAAATNVEITPSADLKNATPVDPAELPADIASLQGQPVLYAFKYLAHPVGIGLRIVKHEDLAVKRTIVESARLYTYESPEGHLITSARFRVKNNRKQYLEMVLPDGAETWGAYLEDRPVKAARNAAGRVLVPLKKTAADAAGELAPFDVELVYYQPRTAGFWGRHRFLAPAIDVDAMEVEWHFFLPRDRRYGAFGGNLHADQPLNRIVYLSGGAYNLASRGDLNALTVGAEFGPGKKKGAPQDQEMLDQLRSLGYIGGGPPGEAGAADKDEAARGRIAGEMNRRDRLENDLKELSKAAPPVVESPVISPGVAGYQMQANQVSNFAVSGGVAQRGGSVARGVLPVRFSIPTDGLRLSFSGRLLTSGERARVSLSGWPLAWTFSPAGIFLMAFLLTLTILRLRAGPACPGPRPSDRGGAAATIAASAGLFLLFILNPDGRIAFGCGMTAALLGFFATRVWSARRLVLGLLLVVPVVGTGFLVAGPAPAFAATAEAARRSLPDLHETKITLSWQDFKALVETTYVPPPPEPEPPAEAVLRSAEYTGRLEPGVLTLDGTLALDVLKKGWIRLPLAYDGTIVSFQGQGAILHRNGSLLEILAKGPASLTLRLALAFPAPGNPGENRIAARLPETPRNLLNLGAAPMFHDLQIEGGLAYGPRQGRLYVALPQNAFTLKYTLPFRRAEERAGEEVKLEPRVQVAGYQLLHLGDGVVSGVLVHDYTVRVAKVDHFDLDLPEGVVVFEATAPGLESWKILKHEGRSLLRVKLLAPLDGRVRVVVQFEGAYDVKAGRLPVPRFAPLAVERESGFVAVAADGAEVELELKGRLLPADVSEIPPDVVAYGGNLISACKYSEAPEQALVKIAEHEDAPVLTAIIESLNATAVLLDNGTEATWIDLSIKNNRKQFLGLTLPGEEVEIWSLLLDGQPAKPKQTGRTVLVPLPRGDGEVASRVSLVLLRKGPEVTMLGRIEPRLPRFDVPVSEALWTVYLPDGRKYVVTGDRFKPVVQTAPLLAAAKPAPSFGFLARSAPQRADNMKLDEESMRQVESKVAAQSEAAAAGGEYGGIASDAAARAQVEQEARVAQQLRQKAGSRKGSLPVHIAIPGGVGALPRVTVSRMLLVGRDDNSFSIRAYPAWLGSLIGLLQPGLILGSGLLFGLLLAGVVGRRLLVRAAVPAALLAILPLGGLGAPAALLLVALVAAMTWAAVFAYRRLQQRLTPATP
ncbi:MAG TPA: hypothetical protein VEW47_05515 [Candidatus Dormibacteraeota bacterium]|nr:hypothetical protein [Candidatus Dormibacteraeota bacterium]